MVLCFLAAAKPWEVRDLTRGQVGAPQEVIESLEAVRFSPEIHDNEPCAICLGDFEEGDELRRLPCGHQQFHAACIDKWLVRNKKCPLCMGDIESTKQM